MMGAPTLASAEPTALAPAARPYFGLALFVLAVAMGLSVVSKRFVPDKWLNQDGTFYFLTLRTLVDRHALAQDATQPRSWYEQDLGWNRNLPADWSDVAVGRGGHWYPKHPILMPLATVPFFLAFGAYGALLLNLLCLGLLPVFAHRIATRFAPRGAALVAAALLALSPYLSGQAYAYSNDLFYAALALASFDAAFSRRAGLAGLLWGLAVFAKATNVVYATAFLALYLLEGDRRSLVRFGLGAAPALSAFAALNTWMYGAPWLTGYNHILVRVNGALAFHDHARDFDWAHLFRHLRHVLLEHGQDALPDRLQINALPFYALAVPGALIALVRLPRKAVPLLLAIAAPLAFNAPFRWFRVEFLAAPAALCLSFIAALMVPWGRPTPSEPVARTGLHWGRLVPAIGLAILLGGAGVRAAIAPHGDWFERHLTSARAYLGPVPCDYFNWQVQRWECSAFDQGRDPLMTGRSLAASPRFGGRADQALLEIRPHPSHQPRRLVYEDVPLAGSLQIRYGLADGAAPRGHLGFAVLVNGLRYPLALGAPGELEIETLDTRAWRGEKGRVAFEVVSDAPDEVGVYFDGGPR